MSEINIYGVGLCYASVCAPKDMPVEEIERQLNEAHPTGVGPWCNGNTTAS